MISIEVIKAEEQYTVKLGGRIDAVTSQEFQDAVLPLVQQSTHAPVLDLAGVEYLSSMGLRVLVILAKECAKKGEKLRLIEVRPDVFSILRLSGFNTFLEIECHAG